MQSVIKQSVIMQSVIMQSVIMQSVIMQSGIMKSVIAPIPCVTSDKTYSNVYSMLTILQVNITQRQ